MFSFTKPLILIEGHLSQWFVMASCSKVASQLYIVFKKKKIKSSNPFSSCCASVSCNFIHLSVPGRSHSRRSRTARGQVLQTSRANPPSSRYKISQGRHRTTKESSASRLFSAVFFRKNKCINQKVFSGVVFRWQLGGWWEALRQNGRKIGESLCFCFRTGFDERQTLCERYAWVFLAFLSARIRLRLASGDFT